MGATKVCSVRLSLALPEETHGRTVGTGARGWPLPCCDGGRGAHLSPPPLQMLAQTRGRGPTRAHWRLLGSARSCNPAMPLSRHCSRLRLCRGRGSVCGFSCACMVAAPPVVAATPTLCARLCTHAAPLCRPLCSCSTIHTCRQMDQHHPGTQANAPSPLRCARVPVSLHRAGPRPFRSAALQAEQHAAAAAATLPRAVSAAAQAANTSPSSTGSQAVTDALAGLAGPELLRAVR